MKNRMLKLKDKSTIPKSTYIIGHIFFGVCLGYDVFVALPMIVPTDYLEQSVVKIIICLIIASLFGITFSYMNNRNFSGIFLDVFTGLGIYIGLIMGKYVPLFMKCILICTSLITLVCLIRIIGRKIKDNDKRKRIIVSRILRSTQAIRWNCGIAFTVILLLVPASLHFKNAEQASVSNSTVYQEEDSSQNPDITEQIPNKLEVHKVYGDEYCLSENLDTIKLIRDDEVFQQLTYEKKKEVVTAVLRCEARYQGLEEFNIYFSNKLDVGTLGQFNYSKRAIIINAKQLKDGTLPGGSAADVLNTCLHECRHYY